MVKFCPRILLFSLVLAGIATAQIQRGIPDKNPNIEINFPNHSYEGTYPQLESVDWQNLSYPLFGHWAHLRNGKYVHFEKGSSYPDAEIKFRKVYYLEGPAEYAVVLLDETTCGANCTDFPSALVFQFSNQCLTLLQTISPEVHHTTGGSKFNPKAQQLIVQATNYGAGAHCCPEYIDVVTYKWTGSKFARAWRKIIPNPDWKP